MADDDETYELKARHLDEAIDVIMWELEGSLDDD